MNLSFNKTLHCVAFLGFMGLALGFLGRWHWALELLCHFRVYQWVLFGLLAFLYFFRKNRLGFFVCFVAFLLLTISMAAYYLPPPIINPSPSKALKIYVLNVHTENREFQKVRQSIENENPDIVGLVEVDSVWHGQLGQYLVTSYPYHHQVIRDDNFGLALYSKAPFVEIQEKQLGKSLVPSIRAVIEWNTRPIALWLVHPMPPIGETYQRYRNDLLVKLGEEVSVEPHAVIVMGDLNVTPFSPWFKTVLGQKLRDSSLGFGLAQTWPASIPKPLRISIDHILVSKHIHVIHKKTLSDVGSDHLPIAARLLIDSGPPPNIN